MKFRLSSKARNAILSIVLGFIIGTILLYVTGFNGFEVLFVLVKGVFSKPKYVAWAIIKATPLIFTGLSVAFAFRTGLFNIGAEGQYMVGAMTAMMVGYAISLPFGLHPMVTILIAMFIAGVYGGIAGFLKSRFGVNEVISTIMLNWIAFFINNELVDSKFFNMTINISHKVQETAKTNILNRWISSESGQAFLGKYPAIDDVFKTNINYGFFIAIVFAILCWILLEKTTLGLQLKAVGLNPLASESAGINVRKNKILAMFISGSLAGAGGAVSVLGVNYGITTLSGMQGFGFDGIAVALIGGGTPFGCVLSGLLFGVLRYGSSKIQVPPYRVPSEVINAVIGVIIFFIAVPKLVELILSYRKRRERNVS